MTRKQIADMPTHVLEQMLRRVIKEACHWQSLLARPHLTTASEDLCNSSLRRYDRLAAAINDELARRGDSSRTTG